MVRCFVPFAGMAPFLVIESEDNASARNRAARILLRKTKGGMNHV